MDSTCLPMKLFSRDMTGQISFPNTSESRRFKEESIHCLVKVKELPGDHRTRFRDCLRDNRCITYKPQSAPFFCLSEESSSASIFICDAIIQKSDTALFTLQTPRKLTDPKSSHSFCSISHGDLPKLCYPDSVLTVMPRQKCSACGQQLQTVRAENVACQAPDDHNYPPLRAVKSIQVNLCDLEKLPRVHFRTPQCVSCGDSINNNVPGNPSTRDKCTQEAHNYGIPICKGNLCPCFTALAQKQHLCLPSKTGKFQTSEKVSDNIETCIPLPQKQNISSSPKPSTLQSFGNSCQSKTLVSVTNSNKEKAHISTHLASSEQHKDGDRCKSRPYRRIIKTDTLSKNILKAEDSTKQLLPHKVKHSYNTDRRTPQPGYDMQHPFLKRKCVRTKQRTPNRESVTPRSKKTIKRSNFHSTHPTTIFHLKITKSSLESQKATPTKKQFPVKQCNVKGGSAISFRGFRWSNDSSAEICRQIVPTIHNTSPMITVTSQPTTTEHTPVVSPAASPIDSAPLTSSLPLWKNIVQFLKKTFLPTSVDPLAKLYSRESQVDAPELLYLLELKQNKLQFVEPALRRSISDVSPQQLFKFGSTSLNSYAPMKSTVKKPSHYEHNFSCQNSAPPDTGYRLFKQEFPVIKQSLKNCRPKSTLGSNSESLQTSLNTHHKQKSRKSIADNDCFSTHEILSGIHNIKPINRSFSSSQNSRTNAFVVPMNRSVGQKNNCACSKEAKVRLSPGSLSPTPRSHSATVTAGVSQGVSSILPETISLRDRQSNPRQKTCDYSL